MKTINAVIIDDEQLAIDTLKWQLKEFCSSVNVLAAFTNPALARDYLQENSEIELCFLDIDMPEMSGFEFLGLWKTLPFDVIFTTAYSEFAIKAFKVSAFDYLLKPIDEEELVVTLEKYEKHKSKDKLPEQLNILLQQLKQTESYSSRIALPTAEGVYMVDVERIIRLEADKNYTTIYVEDSSPILVSKTLKEAEKTLDPKRFFRIHQSHTVDIQKISIYHRGRGGSVTMKSGEMLPVSKHKKESLLLAIGS